MKRKNVRAKQARRYMKYLTKLDRGPLHERCDFLVPLCVFGQLGKHASHSIRR